MGVHFFWYEEQMVSLLPLSKSKKTSNVFGIFLTQQAQETPVFFLGKTFFFFFLYDFLIISIVHSVIHSVNIL